VRGEGGGGRRRGRGEGGRAREHAARRGDVLLGVATILYQHHLLIYSHLFGRQSLSPYTGNPDLPLSLESLAFANQ